MDGLTTEDLLLATLGAEDGGDGVALSTVVERLAGSGRRLSQRVRVTAAVEALSDRGLVRRESSDGGERLSLTGEGRTKARRVAEDLAARPIELVTEEGRRELTVERAAAELDRSPVAIAMDCSEDGVYYHERRIERGELVARSDERERLSGILQRVERTGSGEAVRLVGPGGSGKTDLANAVWAGTSDAVEVVRMGAREAGDEPYQPVRDALDRLGIDDPFDAPGVRADDIETYETQQTGLFTEVTESLTSDSGVRVLFFDDVDDADAATWRYLEYLCRQLPELPLVVVVAHRPGTLPEHSPIHPEAGLEATWIEVGGLDRDGTKRLVEQVIGRRGVPEAFVDAVHERTGGLPLFVETTVETLLETDQLDSGFQWYPTDPDEFDLPEAVTETIQRQAATLEADVRDVLEWVAVARELVPVSLLERAADLPPGRVATILETVGEMGMLRRTTVDGEPHVTFRNDAFGDALAENLSRSERERRHGRVAECLEARIGDRDAPDGRRTADRAATIAYHYERGGDDGRATDWYRTAADRATDVYAHETAIEHWYRAIDLARRAGDTDAVLAANERLAEIYATIGEYERATRHVQFVRERTPGNETPRSQRVAWLAGRIHNARGEYEAAIETARAALGGEASREKCRLLGVLAQAYDGRSDYERVRETARRQRELAADLGASGLEADAIHRLGVAARKQADYGRAREHYEESLEIVREVGDRQGEANSLKNLGDIARKRGDYDRAREQYERSLDIYRAIGHRKGTTESLKGLAAIADRRGAHDRAREYYERSLDICREIGDREGEARCLNNLGFIAEQRGNYDDAREYYEQCLELTRAVGNRRGEAYCLNNLGNVEHVRGAFDRAREYYEESLEIKRAIGDRDGEVYTLNDLGRLARRRGADDRAREYHDRGRELAREAGLSGREAMSLRGLGVLARRQGDYDRAAAHVQQALAAGEAGGERSEVERIRLEQGRLALARGDTTAARDLAERTRAAFEDLGERLWVGRSHRLLGAVAAETGESATALEHWERALETFEGIDVTVDTLETLERLVVTSQSIGDDRRAEEWRRRARTVLADAPDPVSEHHREWIEGHGKPSGGSR